MEFEKNRETWQGTYRQTDSSENSLAMQWLGLSTFTTVARFPSLVRELGSYKLHSGGKRKKRQQDKKMQPRVPEGLLPHRPLSTGEKVCCNVTNLMGHLKECG